MSAHRVTLGSSHVVETTPSDRTTNAMTTSDARPRQAHRLLQMGVLLFVFGLLVGLVVPRFAVPRLGLSVHLLAIMQGLFLSVIGLLWPRLKLTRAMSNGVFWLALYGCFSALAANLLAAVWGAGNSMLPIAAGQARGTGLQEGIITVTLRSAALSLIVAATLILWGLRTSSVDETGNSESSR